MSGSTAGQVGKAVLIAVAVETVVVAVTLVVNFVTKSAPAAWQVFLVPTTGVLIAGVKAGVDVIAARAKQRPEPVPSRSGYPDDVEPGPGMYRQRRSASRDRSGRSLVAVLVVLLAVCGGGGLVATAAVQYGYGWATGNETGPVVFEGAAAGTSGAVRLTVTQVMITRHFTRVDVTVQNTGRDAVSLPLFGNSQLVGAAGRVLNADSFRSQWSDNVVPGTTQSGTINFTGKAPAGNATLSFARIFGPGGGISLVVKPIPIGTT